MIIYHAKEFVRALKKLNPKLKITKFGFPEVQYHGYCSQIKFKNSSFSIPSGYLYEKPIATYTDWADHLKWRGFNKKKVEHRHRSLREAIRILVTWRAITERQGWDLLTKKV